MQLNSKNFKPKKKKMLANLRKLSMISSINTIRMSLQSWSNIEHLWRDK